MATPTIGKAFARAIEKGRGTGPGGQALTMERVEFVLENGRAQVRGVAVPVTGLAFVRPGDEVAVAWRRGRPVAIVKHSARRAKAIPPRLVPTGGVVEVLFFGPVAPGSATVDVWFRNSDQVIRLDVASRLGWTISTSTSRLKWGRNPRFFGVHDGVGQWAVFEITGRDVDQVIGAGTVEAQLIRSYSLAGDATVIDTLTWTYTSSNCVNESGVGPPAVHDQQTQIMTGVVTPARVQAGTVPIIFSGEPGGFNGDPAISTALIDWIVDAEGRLVISFRVDVTMRPRTRCRQVGPPAPGVVNWTQGEFGLITYELSYIYDTVTRAVLYGRVQHAADLAAIGLEVVPLSDTDFGAFLVTAQFPVPNDAHPVVGIFPHVADLRLVDAVSLRYALRARCREYLVGNNAVRTDRVAVAVRTPAFELADPLTSIAPPFSAQEPIMLGVSDHWLLYVPTRVNFLDLQTLALYGFGGQKRIIDQDGPHGLGGDLGDPRPTVGLLRLVEAGGVLYQAAEAGVIIGFEAPPISDAGLAFVDPGEPAAITLQLDTLTLATLPTLAALDPATRLADLAGTDEHQFLLDFLNDRVFAIGDAVTRYLRFANVASFQVINDAAVLPDALPLE